MPTFEWKGTARNGQSQTGVLVADTKDAVITTMRRQQIVVTAVKEKGKEIAVPKFGGKVPPQLILIFTRQFSVMIDPGLRVAVQRTRRRAADADAHRHRAVELHRRLLVARRRHSLRRLVCAAPLSRH